MSSSSAESGEGLVEEILDCEKGRGTAQTHWASGKEVEPLQACPPSVLRVLGPNCWTSHTGPGTPNALAPKISHSHSLHTHRVRAEVKCLTDAAL
jgi:hypothetical protein